MFNMSLRVPTSRALRLLPRQFTNSRCYAPSQLRTLTSRTPRDSNLDPLDPITLHRLEAQRIAYYKRRSYYAGVGLVFGMVAIYLTATSIDLDAMPQKPTKLDSGRRPDDPLVVIGREHKIVVQKLGEEPEEIPDVVETGTSTVPTFPRVVDFYDDETGSKDAAQIEDQLAEYQLLGLGVRTVSFLGIEVYVVGMYIATDDIAKFQASLIKKIDPIASTLVAGEKEKLKALLFDSEKSEEIWGSVLKETGIRTILRIVPTKNTDFHHLRDAWVRHLTARAQNPRYKEEFGDESFGASVQEFKALFNRGSVPKGKELLLSRDAKGKFVVWYDDGKNGAQRVGQVKDERISRGLWLNYVGGKSVASEGARKSIIDGIMGFVERPVGTVATQVHV